MTLYPEAQRKAQRELDALTKPGHLPNFEDAGNFPYITAVVQEVLRWNPITPLSECLLLGFFSKALTNALSTLIIMMEYRCT
jgi:cytochrome P450